jgi:hypothetical protein
VVYRKFILTKTGGGRSSLSIGVIRTAFLKAEHTSQVWNIKHPESHLVVIFSARNAVQR